MCAGDRLDRSAVTALGWWLCEALLYHHSVVVHAHMSLHIISHVCKYVHIDIEAVQCLSHRGGDPGQ